MGIKLINPDAFLDLGYPPGYSFCEKFLSSGEFTVDFLSQVRVLKRSELKTKAGYAINIAEALEKGELDPKDFLLEYVKKPRTWLSFKLGSYLRIPQLKAPDELLTSFGKPEWYGPIKEPKSSKVWYIRTYEIPHRIPTSVSNVEDINNPENQETYEVRSIRWPIIAEVSEKYVALSWEGFSHTEEAKPNSRNQYSFWLHISKVFEELEEHIGGDWEYPELHTLLLHTLWDKFIEDKEYIWSHKRVRAHSSGIALNAHSSSDTETDFEEKGLKALSRKLAEAALDSLNYSFPHDPKKLSQVESSILNTLIREWGTKSYEFTLKKAEISQSGLNAPDIGNKDNNESLQLSANLETIFRVHCYFGLDSQSKTQDSLQHLKCYKECNFSTGVLKFLLKELGIEETAWPNSLVSIS